MLCSHQKKFIYFKTRKTAGTSVEIFFERYCVPAGHFRGVHAVRETITETGIIGSRMEGKRRKDIYYNHMPASEIREKLGRAVFDSYYKFCVIRNPYDKWVSRYWWDLKLDDGKLARAGELPFEKIRRSFNRYVSEHAGRLCDDRNIYMIEDVPVVDKFIRFENLLDDIKDVCDVLRIEFERDVLGSYKSGFRVRPEHYAEYYDNRSRKAIEREFAFEIERFGYSLN